MKIEIDINDSFLEQLKDSDVSKIVNELLSGYLCSGPLNFMELLLWKKHIELKLSQLQSDLDQHRIGCKCESTSIILDTNVNQRLVGKKSLLDANDFGFLQQAQVKPTSRTKVDTQVPMMDVVTDIPI